MTLTPDIAARFAQAALGHVTREYPHKLDHVMSGDADVLPPRVLHPIFHGSFDWHSCVHSYWLLTRLRRLFPDLPEAAAIGDLIGLMMVPEKVAGEVEYLKRPYAGGFSRPYGWGWLLALHREAQKAADPAQAEALAPLAAAIADLFRSYLPRLTYPIRVGTHFNTAFASILALDWAEANDADLAGLIRQRSTDYFGADRDCPAWEPGGDEFLSSSLVEAMLMRRVLEPAAFADWFGAFLPGLAEGRPEALFTPAHVSDRSDGKIAHLDGFNFCRAWCWRGIADVLPADGQARALATADAHLAASMAHVTGDYMGEHWLATFATLALEGL